ncbi:MAG: hypothetical protein QGI21_02960 [Candidatus Poseidoniaceae archaeon]|jgi:hypothetical protein|nr:hypothetical protein [Candidatus Poseidoniaceae archaeon]
MVNIAKFKDPMHLGTVEGDVLPHEHIELAQSPSGELGPRCKSCGTRMTFGEAMVVDKDYYCWEHYVLVTGSDTATVERERDVRFWKE